MEYESNYLNLTKKCLLCFGAWPLKLPVYMNFIYQTFRGFMFTYYTIFVVTITVGLKDILHENAKVQANTLQYAFTYLFLFWKLILSQNGEIRKFMMTISKKERLIMNGDDDGIKTVYNKCVKFNNRTFYILSSNCSALLLLFVVISATEVINWPNADQSSNSTLPRRELDLPQAFPFDDQEYFELEFFFQTTGRFLCGVLFVVAETLLNSLVYFPAVLLRVLGYNFKQFGNKTCGGSINAEAFLKGLVLEHKQIIEYVIHLNDVLKWFLSVDFILRSYHISLIMMDLLTLLERGVFDMEFFVTFTFTFAFLEITFVQIFCLYYNCNEIVFQSIQIGHCIFQSNWYEQSPSVKRGLLIVIIRSQKPLEMRIGNLYPIGTDLIIGFVKAAYTYALLSLIDLVNV